MDNAAIVRSFFLCWGAQDIELAAMHFHEDMVYELHSVTAELPYCGVTSGRAACRDLLFTIIRDFDYLKYEAHINSVEDDVVRAQVSFSYRHRQSGEVLDGTRRLVFRIKDGLIIRMDRYHDDERVDAFIRLTRQSVATDQVVGPPVLRTTIGSERDGLESVHPTSTLDHGSPAWQWGREPPHLERRGPRLHDHQIAASWIACWSAQDVEMTLAHLHEDIVYKVHGTRDVLPFSGEKRGHEALRDLMFTVLADFDVLFYSPNFIRTTSSGARAHVGYIYRHRATGEILEGTRRLLLQFRDGLIVRIDGYYDDLMIEAFLRLTQHRIATNQIVRTPGLPNPRTKEGSGAGA